MTPEEKQALTDSMIEFGGNFCRNLAQAMRSADPQNFERLCNAFPEIVSKYKKGE